MDVIEKFVADLLCKTLKVTDPAKVVAVEAAAPTIVSGAIAAVNVIQIARGK
jgi:hypothetical protein